MLLKIKSSSKLTIVISQKSNSVLKQTSTPSALLGFSSYTSYQTNMGIPHSLPTEKRATKVTLFFSVEEIKALHQRFRQLVPQNHVVFLENFTAYCMWSVTCRTAETAKIFFRAFDIQKRGYFDFEDFCMTTGALTRGTSGQLAEVLFRMMSDSVMSVAEAEREIEMEEARMSGGILTSSDDDQRKLAAATAAGGGKSQSPYRETSSDQFVRYQDVVDCLQAIDTTFFSLKCDGASAQSVAGRLPFDEHGHLSFRDLKSYAADKLAL